MARFLTTSATNYYLEELIKNADKILVLISPYIKVNDRMRELIEDKNREQIAIRVVYGKKHQPEEIGWLKNLSFAKVRYCKNLHAKCYLSEKQCIITSLNLYDFSQINNNEMGVLISQAEDTELYSDTFKEVKRLLRISKDAKFSPHSKSATLEDQQHPEADSDGKLTSSKLAKKLRVTTIDLLNHMVEHGLLELQNGKHSLTPEGVRNGGEYRSNSRFGPYFLWPENVFEQPS
ncbi:MAG: phospholipase D-like domain-containing protein [Planctomycetota bacterium]